MKPRRLRSLVSLASALVIALTLTPAARAQSGQPISLTVDATQTQKKILHAHLVMPVKPGPLTLYYPKWIPGEHGPDGPINDLTGLKFEADGKSIPWQRDLLDVFTFHVDIPAGATHLDAHYDYIEPNGVSATDKLMILEWNEAVLYPAGTPSAQLMYETTLIMPDGWKFGTALPVATQSANRVSFKPISLDLLVDSPVITGEYYRAIDLTPPGEPIHHEIDMVADSEAALAMSPQIQKAMINLVAESGKLFGARHYRDYHFLFTLSDHVAHFGLEHHESNDSRLPERTLLLPSAGMSLGGLLSHEFVHSWNGKFRRPADLTTPEFETPMKTDLLWGYEGLTDYLGPMLAARSGLWTSEEYHEYLAAIAAMLGPGRPGRTWRPLLDTAVGEPGLGFGARGWLNWRRGTDYYDEGDLVWLEVATIIHRETKGQKSIDDFCHAFHGGKSGPPEVRPYNFDDVVSALNSVVAYDWRGFWTERLTNHGPGAPLGGIEGSGWKLVYDETPSDLLRGAEREYNMVEEGYTIGLLLRQDGGVIDTIEGMTAAKAGIGPGMKVIAVNGRKFSADGLHEAIKAAKGNSEPIELIVENTDYLKIYKLDYHEGEKYPHLVRDEAKPDLLSEIIKAR